LNISHYQHVEQQAIYIIFANKLDQTIRLSLSMNLASPCLRFLSSLCLAKKLYRSWEANPQYYHHLVSEGSKSGIITIILSASVCHVYWN
jgi:hypothetical protein